MGHLEEKGHLLVNDLECRIIQCILVWDGHNHCLFYGNPVLNQPEPTSISMYDYV